MCREAGADAVEPRYGSAGEPEDGRGRHGLQPDPPLRLPAPVPHPSQVRAVRLAGQRATRRRPLDGAATGPGLGTVRRSGRGLAEHLGELRKRRQRRGGRRVKIGDPAVLARLQLLHRRCAAGAPRGRAAVDALLAEVAAAQLHWTGDTAPTGADAVLPAPERVPSPRATPADALSAVAPPSRLAAAAAALSAFPELAEVLREAAARPPNRSETRSRGGPVERSATRGPLAG